MSAIVIDTETTGIDEPEVIELAISDALDKPSSAAAVELLRFKPSKPISLGAMATHHIIDDDLAGCEPWPGHYDLPSADYIVGHNVDYDWKAIGGRDEITKRICTLALCRYLWPLTGSHTLGAMIYYLWPQHEARDRLKAAHSAVADVAMTIGLLHKISEKTGIDEWPALWELSEKARIPTLMPFGKHKGVEIAKVPRDYRQWLLGQPDVDPYLRKALTK